MREPIVIKIWPLGIVLLVVLWAALAWGQPTHLIVNLQKARLTWAWEQGSGTMVEKFQIRCGPSPGEQTVYLEIADPAARAVPLAQVPLTGGTWYCRFSAANQYGTSPPSNEISFSVGQSPAAGTLFEIKAE